jgi:GR25 family glycosyltransferase involved in LPS biosynthesis
LRTFCIYCPELPDRKQAAEEHFKARKIPVEWVAGIHARTAGLSTRHYYDNDNPSLGYTIPAKHVGLCLSHYVVWSIIAHSQERTALVLEDDAELPENWSSKLEHTLAEAQDFDILLVGSCNTEDKPKQHIGASIWRIESAMCTHAYVVTRDACKRLIEQQRKIYAPIDIALLEQSYPHLKALTVLPRICGQRSTVLAP